MPDPQPAVATIESSLNDAVPVVANGQSAPLKPPHVETPPDDGGRGSRTNEHGFPATVGIKEDGYVFSRVHVSFSFPEGPVRTSLEQAGAEWPSISDRAGPALSWTRQEVQPADRAPLKTLDGSRMRKGVL